MLSLMRRHAKSWFIKIALGLVAVVFIFWGVGAYSAKERGRLAVVNGEPITVVDYNKAYRDLVDSARRTFGDALNEDLIKRLNIRSQALERLISEKLALQAAQDGGVSISDEVLREIIRSLPAFQENGQFSARLYQRVLAANGFDPASFEAAQRKELTMARLRSRPEFLAQASVPEARVFFHWQRDEVKVSFAAFDPLTFESRVKVEEPALAAFFKENQEGYRVPEKVEAAYLAFRPEDYVGQVKIDPEELREYYEITQASYRQPERIKLRDILLPFPASAEQAAMDKVKAEAEKAAAEAKSGTDFLALAKKFNPKEIGRAHV
jgi:peptidyl-prolyl cis-trans isomerase D